MSEELLYTSAPRGLKAGSRGFCTVEATAGMPPTVAQLLESLSGYRHLKAPGDPANPVVLRHVIATVAGAPTHILSRIADAGLDYSGRSNKIAHHVALPRGGLNAAGPAWTQLQDGFHQATWDGEAKTIPTGPSLPAADVPPAPCRTWAGVAGDAGWAGVLADAVATGSPAPLPIVVRADQDILSLVGEAIALLPPGLRWQATYTTFHTQLPPGAQCAWRFVIDGTKEAEETLKRRDRNQLDLRQPLGSPPAGPWVEAARTGERPSQPATAPAGVRKAIRTEASPFIEDPGELTVAAPGWEPNRPTPPPPPPGRTAPHSPRDDFRQPPAKRPVGPIVVTLVALLATGVIGGLVVATTVPWKSLAEKEKIADIEAVAESDLESGETTASPQTDSETSGTAPEEPVTADLSRPAVDSGIGKETVKRSAEQAFDEPNPMGVVSQASDLLAEDDSASKESPALDPDISSELTPEPTTFLAGTRLVALQGPSQSRPSVVMQSKSLATKDTRVSFVVPQRDARLLKQSNESGALAIRMRDDLDSPGEPVRKAFMSIAIRPGTARIRWLGGFRPPSVQVIAVEFAAADGSPREVAQLNSILKLEPLVDVGQSQAIPVEIMDSYLGQSWLIKLGPYIEPAELVVRMSDGSRPVNTAIEFDFRREVARRSSESRIRLSLTIADDEERLRKEYVNARSEWDSKRFKALARVKVTINELKKERQGAKEGSGKMGSKAESSQLKLEEEKAGILEMDLDSLITKVLAVRRSSVGDAGGVRRAIDTLSRQEKVVGSRFPLFDAKAWANFALGRTVQEKATLDAWRMKGGFDVVVRGTVLSDGTDCDLVLATTRDIPEAPRDE